MHTHTPYNLRKARTLFSIIRREPKAEYTAEHNTYDVCRLLHKEQEKRPIVL